MKRLLFPSVFLANAVLLNGSVLLSRSRSRHTETFSGTDLRSFAFQNEWAVKQVKIGDKVMKFDYRTLAANLPLDGIYTSRCMVEEVHLLKSMTHNGAIKSAFINLR